MSHVVFKVIISSVLAGSIAGCGSDTETAGEPSPEVSAGEPALGAAETTSTDASQWTVSSDMNVPADQIGSDEKLAAVLGSEDIPYPLYPNSSKYRIGGENGLKIVLFQTEDSFEEVDAFFQSTAKLPRLSAMSDYVRYSIDQNDKDPWETTKPGIVIHQFNDANERQVLGADGSAKTNIIMSFQ